MKTARSASFLVVVAALMSAGPAPAPPPAAAPVAVAGGHCAPAIVTPVPGDPGAYRIQTPHGITIARRAVPVAANATALAVFRVFPSSFDADGDSLGTLHDTILVAPGTTVRWVRAGPGFHTITNGADSSDPNAALEFSIIFDEATNVAERVFTTAGRHDFFCFIHEPLMEGSIIVTSATAGVGPSGVLTRPAFTRPPVPNPSRGALGFAIALPRSAQVSLAVHDIAGRIVARLQDGALPAGEYPFRWDGRGTDGRLVQSGRYFIRLQAGSVLETRPVSIVR